MRAKLLATLLAASLAIPAVMADSVGPGGTWDGISSFGVVKTPLLASSDSFSVPISYHSTFAFSNWAGVIVDINIDPNPTEAHFTGAVGRPPDGIAPGGAGFMPTFNGMPFNGMPAAGPVVTFWSNNAMNSGTTPGTTPLGSSVPFPVGAITFHATNTDPQYNSDVDITLSAWNIFHVASAQASGVSTIPASIWLYVPAGGGPWEPVTPGGGVWVHNTQTFTTHMLSSMFWATTFFIGGQGGIGVEHIPEPASAALLLSGVGALLVALRRRRA